MEREQEFLRTEESKNVLSLELHETVSRWNAVQQHEEHLLICERVSVRVFNFFFFSNWEKKKEREKGEKRKRESRFVK